MLGISIWEWNVMVFWDCKKVGFKNLFEKFFFILDLLGEFYVGKFRFVFFSERYEVSWREKVIDCRRDGNVFFVNMLI